MYFIDDCTEKFLAAELNTGLQGSQGQHNRQKNLLQTQKIEQGTWKTKSQGYWDLLFIEFLKFGTDRCMYQQFAHMQKCYKEQISS